MAIAFDSVASATGSSGTTLTWSHTTTGARLILLVAVGRAATAQVTGVTYLSILPMTRLTGVTTGGFDWFWLQVGAADLGTHDVEVTFDVDPGPRAGISVSYTGVGSSTIWASPPLVQVTGTNTTPHLSRSTFAQGMTIDAALVQNTGGGATLTVNGSQTQRAQVSTGAGAGHVRMAVSDKPWSSGSLIAMDWTLSASKTWDQAAVTLHIAYAATGLERLSGFI